MDDVEITEIQGSIRDNVIIKNILEIGPVLYDIKPIEKVCIPKSCGKKNIPTFMNPFMQILCAFLLNISSGVQSGRSFEKHKRDVRRFRP